MNSFDDSVLYALKAVDHFATQPSRHFKETNAEGSADSRIPVEPHHTEPESKNIFCEEPNFVDGVLSKLERLILNDDWISNPDALSNGIDTESSQTEHKQLPKLSALDRTVVTSYSLQAYIKLLPRPHSVAVAKHIYKATNDSLCQFLRFPNAKSFFHADFYRGFDAAYKLARKHASTENQKLIFLSPGLTSVDLPEYFRTELATEDVKWLPALSTPLAGIDSRLDVSAFERQLEQDYEEGGKAPLLVVAVVGSFFFGHNDLVSKLIELRSRFKFWLHLVGLNLAALAAKDAQSHLLSVLQATNSVTLPLESWLGVHGLPHLTMYKPTSPGEEKIESIDQRNFHIHLDSLSWWVVINEIGITGLQNRIDNSYALIKAMLKCLYQYNERIEVLGWGGSTVESVLNKIDKKMITPPAVITFKYSPSKLSSDVKLTLDYIDCLNVWLSQGLVHDCPWLSLRVVDLSKVNLGFGLRYCPLESSASQGCSLDKIIVFKKRLDSMLNILDVTVKSKLNLPITLLTIPDLVAVTVPKWAGVTGIVYIPSIMKSEVGSSPDQMVSSPIDTWTDQQKEQVSHLNIELVRALRNMDTAFSLGDSEEGIKCIKFGMLADERDLVELIKLVLEKGKEIEESSQYMESLADVVRHGIEAANADLRKESESKFMNEGILRHVPIFGSVLNWWSPLPKEHSDVRGRAFDLITGRILPTNEVFKHKTSRQSIDNSEEAKMEMIEETQSEDNEE